MASKIKRVIETELGTIQVRYLCMCRDLTRNFNAQMICRHVGKRQKDRKLWVGNLQKWMIDLTTNQSNIYIEYTHMHMIDHT